MKEKTSADRNSNYEKIGSNEMPALHFVGQDYTTSTKFQCNYETGLLQKIVKQKAAREFFFLYTDQVFSYDMSYFRALNLNLQPVSINDWIHILAKTKELEQFC